MNYKRIHDLIIERAKNRTLEGYKECHHIIPRCMGGTDEPENLVELTPEEHFVVHQLLVKMYPEHGGLIYAANQMCIGHKGKRTNKRYGWLKRKYSKQRKIDSIGQGNNQYGTMWINRIGTTENKKIKKSEPMPDGWQKGRKFKLVEKKCRICKKVHYNSNSCCSKICTSKLKKCIASKIGKRKRSSLERENMKKSLLGKNKNKSYNKGKMNPNYGVKRKWMIDTNENDRLVNISDIKEKIELGWKYKY